MIECLVESGNRLGEGPLWHPEQNSLYWTDINGFRLERYRLDGGVRTTWGFDEPVCALALTSEPEMLLVVLGSRIILWRAETGERRTLWVLPEAPNYRLNDGAVGPDGAFWVGSMRNNIAADGRALAIEDRGGTIYRVDNEGAATIWDDDYAITNGLHWSPDGGTFYCASSLDNIIYAYGGGPTTRRIFNSGFARGLPDGAAIDAEGGLWSCRYGGGCLVRFTPDGAVERVVEMPVSHITNGVFGGEGLRTLFVTTASLGVPKNEILAGGIFSLDSGVSGLPPARFRLP